MLIRNSKSYLASLVVEKLFIIIDIKIVGKEMLWKKPEGILIMKVSLFNYTFIRRKRHFPKSGYTTDLCVIPEQSKN